MKKLPENIRTLILYSLTVSVCLFSLYLITLENETVNSAESPPPKRSSFPTPLQLQKNPLSITLSVERALNPFSEDFSWYLSVNSSGQATLTVETHPENTTYQFQISPKEMQKLREKIIDQRFFELEDYYGEPVMGATTSSVTITLGHYIKSIRIHFLLNYINETYPDKLEENKQKELARLLRVRHLIRGWFDQPTAFDCRESDKRVLHFIEETTPHET